MPDLFRNLSAEAPSFEPIRLLQTTGELKKHQRRDRCFTSKEYHPFAFLTRLKRSVYTSQHARNYCYFQCFMSRESLPFAFVLRGMRSVYASWHARKSCYFSYCQMGCHRFVNDI